MLDVVRKESESCDCLQVTKNQDCFFFKFLLLLSCELSLKVVMFVIVVFVAFDGFKVYKSYVGSTFSFEKNKQFYRFFFF